MERCIMANSGIVKLLIGEVKAVAVDGTERLLHVGEKVLLNEQIITGDAGSIAIDFTDGTRMDLGRGSSTMLTTDLLGTTAATVQSVSSAEGEVEAIQQALAADQTFDPSKLAAPAAGGVQETQSLEDNGQSIVEVDYLNPAMTPVNGFETTDIDNADTLVLDLTQADLILAPLSATAPIEPVQVDPAVQVIDERIDLAVADNVIAEDATSAVSGSFVLTTPEGLTSITVANETILEAGLLNSGVTPVVLDSVLGILTIDGFDAATGTVNYSYEQKGGHKDHSVIDDGDATNGSEFDGSVIDHFAITVTDDNNVTSAPDVLDILISDTVPVAINNFERMSLDDSVLGDNVITNKRSPIDDAPDDEIGADGAVLSKVFVDLNDNGRFDEGIEQEKSFLNQNDILQFDTDNGTLFIRGDGKYGYASKINGGVTEVKDTFGYELTDSDGDLSAALLVIQQVLETGVNTGEDTF